MAYLDKIKNPVSVAKERSPSLPTPPGAKKPGPVRQSLVKKAKFLERNPVSKSPRAIALPANPTRRQETGTRATIFGKKSEIFGKKPGF